MVALGQAKNYTGVQGGLTQQRDILMTEYIQVITTLDSREAAEKLAGLVLEKRLGACVQILGPVSSFFWWKGKVDRAEEFCCLIKSRHGLYHELEKEIKAAHSYEVPEILALPVIDGSSDYLGWLAAELRK